VIDDGSAPARPRRRRARIVRVVAPQRRRSQAPRWRATRGPTRPARGSSIPPTRAPTRRRASVTVRVARRPRRSRRSRARPRTLLNVLRGRRAQSHNSAFPAQTFEPFVAAVARARVASDHRAAPRSAPTTDPAFPNPRGVRALGPNHVLRSLVGLGRRGNDGKASVFALQYRHDAAQSAAREGN